MIFAVVLEPDAVLNPKKKVFEEIQVEIYSCILCTYLLEGEVQYCMCKVQDKLVYFAG